MSIKEKWYPGAPSVRGIYECRPRFWRGKVRNVEWWTLHGRMVYRVFSTKPGEDVWNEANWTCWFFEYRRVS